MWAANGKTELHPLIVVVFFLVWATVFGSYLFGSIYVAPKALSRWASDRDLKILQKSKAGFWRRYSVSPSNIQVVYSVVIQDEKGATYSGLAKVGPYGWPSYSPARCPVEVHWDDEVDRDWADF